MGLRLQLPRFAGAAGQEEAVDCRCLVLWQGFAVGQNLGHHLLLCSIHSSLGALQQVCWTASRACSGSALYAHSKMHLNKQFLQKDIADCKLEQCRQICPEKP